MVARRGAILRSVYSRYDIKDRRSNPFSNQHIIIGEAPEPAVRIIGRFRLVCRLQASVILALLRDLRACDSHIQKRYLILFVQLKIRGITLSDFSNLGWSVRTSETFKPVDRKISVFGPRQKGCTKDLITVYSFAAKTSNVVVRWYIIALHVQPI
jgi:hypothetical protein